MRTGYLITVFFIYLHLIIPYTGASQAGFTQAGNTSSQNVNTYTR